MKKYLTRLALPGILAATSLLATACPTTPPAAANWSFQASQVTVNESQDEVRDPIFGACISFTGCSDEPYVLNVNFRVKIGVPNSAQTFVTGSRSNAPQGVDPGTTINIANGSGLSAKANFNGVTPLDVLDIVTNNGQLEVLGTYVFALEEDAVSVASAATGTATILKDVLNDTLGAGQIPSDLSTLLSYITSNLGSAFGLLGANIPLFGLGDDVMGGGLYVGIAAKGELANIVNGSIGTTTFPNISIPVVDLPPDITHGGFYVTSGTKTFSHRWNCCGGGHTWTFVAGPA